MDGCGVGGKKERCVNRGWVTGRAATSKGERFVGAHHKVSRGASVSALDRDVTRARRFICHCRSSFRATCLDSFPFASSSSREAATFLHNVRTCSFFLSDRNDTANVSVKNSNGTREKGEGRRQRPFSSRRVEALSRGCLLPATIHPVVARCFSPPIHATHREAPTNEASEACNSRDEAARSRHSRTKMSARIQG